MKKFCFHRRALPLLTGLALALAPTFSWSVGLGELRVVSAADEPLRAEIPLNGSAEELAGASARLPSREIFRQSGLEFRPGLNELMLFVVRRGDQSLVEIRSTKPVTEGDLRFLLELEWPSGRLMREYGLKTGAAKSLPVRAESLGLVKKPLSVKEAPAPSGTAHIVQPGETLKRIAEDRRYGGVSLEQMLLGLFKANPDAFADRNINRLKTGAILNVPDEAFVTAIPEGEAKRFYLSLAGDWGAYRRTLAATSEQMLPAGDGATQTSSGKITAQAQAFVPASTSAQDQVKVDVVQPDIKDRLGNKAAAIADRVAQEKALKDAQERLLLLEKNVEDLQRLLQLRSGDLANLQQSAANGPQLGTQLQAALKNPVALSWLGGFLALLVALLLVIRRKTPATVTEVKAGPAEISSLSEQKVPEPVASAVPEFDMRRISLDLSAQPKDDGNPIWGTSPRRGPQSGNTGQG